MGTTKPTRTMMRRCPAIPKCTKHHCTTHQCTNAPCTTHQCINAPMHQCIMHQCINIGRAVDRGRLGAAAPAQHAACPGGEGGPAGGGGRGAALGLGAKRALGLGAAFPGGETGRPGPLGHVCAWHACECRRRGRRAAPGAAAREHGRREEEDVRCCRSLSSPCCGAVEQYRNGEVCRRDGGW